MVTLTTSPPDERLLVERWIEYKEHNEGRAARTIGHYRWNLANLRGYLLERQLSLLTATPDAIEDFAGRHQHARGVKPTSRRVTVSTIRGFYQWLTRKGVIDENPAACLASPKSATPLPRVMPMNLAEKLLMAPGIETLIGLRDTAILGVLIGTGCRVSGVAALNERDLLWTQSSAGTERLILRLREKGKKERLVPVPLECSLLIRAYLGHPDLARIDRELPGGDRVLFATVLNKRNVPPHLYYGENRRMSRWAVFSMMRSHGLRVGIPKEYCHPHALRHLYGTELAEHDVDLLMRQNLLGHSTPATTEIYTHLATRKLIETIDRANPLGKMKSSPTYPLAERFRRAVRK